MTITKQDLICEEVTEKFCWINHEEFNVDLYKNRPKSALFSKIKEQDEEIKWLLEKFYELKRLKP